MTVGRELGANPIEHRQGHMTDKPIIGFIGLGLMGHGMAKNILEKGYQLLIMGHRNRQPVEDLLSRGAEEVDTPAAMAGRADIIFLCVSGSPQVEELLRGKNGILATARAGLIVVDSSTSDPVSTLALAEELAAVGCRLADAPLGRTPKEAEAGTLDTMVGADEQTFAAIRPVIECWAGNIVHLGPVGNGHKMKLINNFISIGYGALYSEALAVCRRSGITPQQFHAVIGSSRMANGFYETFMKYVIDGDRDAHKFTLINAHKDMCYLANMATAAGAANFLGSVVKNYLSTAEAMGKGDHYLPMLADHVAAINGVSLTED
jgi:3-hydroxyisobutyrate dehydrogenase-like beta-hydroxyacid dehydrogenase